VGSLAAVHSSRVGSRLQLDLDEPYGGRSRKPGVSFRASFRDHKGKDLALFKRQADEPRRMLWLPRVSGT
jgi:hypothetical protein